MTASIKAVQPRLLMWSSGAPARRVRELTDEECRGLEASAANYAERGRQYRRELVARAT